MAFVRLLTVENPLHAGVEKKKTINFKSAIYSSLNAHDLKPLFSRLNFLLSVQEGGNHLPSFLECFLLCFAIDVFFFSSYFLFSGGTTGPEDGRSSPGTVFTALMAPNKAILLMIMGRGCMAATNWTKLSPTFEDLWASYLPNIPTTPLAVDAADYIVASQGPFQVLSLDVSDLEPLDGGPDAMARVYCSDGSSDVGTWPLDGIRAGPSITCGVDVTCSGPTGTQCRAEAGQGTHSVMLKQKEGTHWARQSALPAWALYRFPPVPRALSLTVRFDLDSRYPSELYGGNPCTSLPSSEYACSLCIDSDYGEWDRNVGAGFFLLWSATGRDEWVVTGPHSPEDPGVYSKEEKFGILNSPAELQLQDDEEIVLLFVVFNQYAGWTEVASSATDSASLGAQCTVGNSKSDYPSPLWPTATSTVKNKPFMIQKITVFTRGEFKLEKEPTGPVLPLSSATTLPRLFGSDGFWFNSTVAPFLELPCDISASAFSHGGWPGGKGVVDFKSVFEEAALGYASCTDSIVSSSGGSTIDAHWAAAKYLDSSSSTLRPFERIAALHLLRRLHACHYRGIGGYSSWGPQQVCQFSEQETSRLRSAVITRELHLDWGDAVEGTGRWYWEYPWLGAGGYDLATAETMKYWSLVVDTLRPWLSAENHTAIEAKMDERITSFQTIFYSGGWALWNGNNWTPYLCEGALYWAITYWHEKPTIARGVLQIIYDVMWLHGPMYASETGVNIDRHGNLASSKASVYVEGVSQYSFMSTGSTLNMAALLRASFGQAPPALKALAVEIERVYSWQLATVGSDAYLVPFGDSHRARGFGAPDVLNAMLAREIMFNVSSTTAAAAVGGTNVGGVGPVGLNYVAGSNSREAFQARSRAMEDRLTLESACEVKKWFASSYFQSYHHPFEFIPELAKNWSAIIEGCTAGGGLLSARPANLVNRLRVSLLMEGLPRCGRLCCPRLHSTIRLPGLRPRMKFVCKTRTHQATARGVCWQTLRR